MPAVIAVVFWVVVIGLIVTKRVSGTALLTVLANSLVALIWGVLGVAVIAAAEGWGKALGVAMLAYSIYGVFRHLPVEDVWQGKATPVTSGRVAARPFPNGCPSCSRPVPQNATACPYCTATLPTVAPPPPPPPVHPGTSAVRPAPPPEEPIGEGQR